MDDSSSVGVKVFGLWVLHKNVALERAWLREWIVAIAAYEWPVLRVPSLVREEVRALVEHFVAVIVLTPEHRPRLTCQCVEGFESLALAGVIGLFNPSWAKGHLRCCHCILVHR